MNIRKTVLLSAMVCLSMEASAAPSVTFHVAPNGNDSWSGKPSRPGFFRKDGPFATLPAALQAARAAKQAASESLDVSIVVQKGTYLLKEPLRFGPEDSGLTISGEGTVSGGVRITNWSPATLKGRKVLSAPVPAGFIFDQLWVNGRRATPARHPNTGYLGVASVPDKTPSWEQGQARFVYKEGDLPGWTDLDPEAEVVVMCRWVESRLPIASLDPTSRTLNFKKRAVFQLAPGDPWYMQGVAEALDLPGEWFLDSRKHTVFYAPREGEPARSIKAIAPVLQQLVRFEGEPSKGQFISRITIKGLTFSHNEWTYPPSGKKEDQPERGGAVQAAYPCPGAVYAAGLRESVFENCNFRNLGTYGLELGAGCRSNKVTQCTFADLGAGGLKIGQTSVPTGEEQTSAIDVTNCKLSDGGKIFHSAVGIWIGQAYNNSIIGNEISDFFYTGISAGWTWGYGPSLCRSNLIAFNKVHHIGRKSDGDGPILSDMGGIYTLGMQPGTRIINNLWHDIAGFRYGGWGIYFDEGSSSILAVSNVVYNTTHGGFHQHYGATNMVWNNVFAFAKHHQLQRTRAEPHSSFSFKTNIVVIDQGVFLGGDWKGGQFEMDHNVFYDLRPGVETNAFFGGMTFEGWQKSGHDTNSVLKDPLFKNAPGYDFTLAPGSPAISAGFKPITPPK